MQQQTPASEHECPASVAKKGPGLNIVTIGCNSPHCHTLPQHATTNHNKPLPASMNALLASQPINSSWECMGPGLITLGIWWYSNVFVYFCICICICVCVYMSIFCMILLVMPFDIVWYLRATSTIFSEQVIMPFKADQTVLSTDTIRRAEKELCHGWHGFPTGHVFFVWCWYVLNQRFISFYHVSSYLDISGSSRVKLVGGIFTCFERTHLFIDLFKVSFTVLHVKTDQVLSYERQRTCFGQSKATSTKSGIELETRSSQTFSCFPLTVHGVQFLKVNIRVSKPLARCLWPSVTNWQWFRAENGKLRSLRGKSRILGRCYLWEVKRLLETQGKERGYCWASECCLHHWWLHMLSLEQ